MICLKKMYRITLFVPPSHLEKVVDSITNTDSLRYGNYDSVVWWSSEGIEQFRPLEEALPTEGNKNTKEKLPSVMVQFSLPHDEKILEKMIKEGILPVHPWEEPVIIIQEVMTTRTSAVESFCMEL